MNANRMPLIDAFKAIGSQLIVLHHLAAYGPLASTAQEVAPGTLGWFYDYARIAVQVFLVIAGFLAARGMSPQGGALAGSPWPLIAKRYLRLAIPYFVAIALAVAGAALARIWMDDEAIPAAPTLAQLAAHALLLQSVLGFDPLSAGLWYRHCRGHDLSWHILSVLRSQFRQERKFKATGGQPSGWLFCMENRPTPCCTAIQCEWSRVSDKFYMFNTKAVRGETR